MRIRLERVGTVFELEMKPMKERRFRALYLLAVAALYGRVAIRIAAVCGLPGLIVLGLATVVYMAIDSI